METLFTISVAAIAGAQVCHAVARVKKLRPLAQYLALAVGITSVVFPFVAIVTLVCTTMLQRVPARRKTRA